MSKQIHIIYVTVKCIFKFPFIAKPSSSNAAKETKETKQTKEMNGPNESRETIWVVEMSETQIFGWGAGKEVTHTSVGAFSSKAAAIENAKVSMTNIDNCEDLFGPDGEMEVDGWEDVEDNSDTVGDDGGLLFRVSGEGEEYSVSIKKVTLNKPIKKKKSY